MAIHTVITTMAANEAPRETVMSRAFAGFLPALAEFVQAERDYEDVAHSQDPAYRIWQRDAELAQERLTGSIRRFNTLQQEIPEDRPLRRFVTLVDTMLGDEEPGHAKRLHRKMQIAFFAEFQVPGIGATAMHRNALLVQARHLVSAMAALPLFDGEDISVTGAGPDFSAGPI